MDPGFFVASIMITQQQYDTYMVRIDELMKKGEANCSKEELDEIEIKSQLCEQFEDKKDPLQ